MHVVRHSDAAAFARRVRLLLSAAEAENSLTLGISAGLADGYSGERPYLATVEDRERVIGVALMTPPRKLVLTAAPREALAALCRDVADAGLAMPGIVGRADVADAFAAMWRERTGAVTRLEHRLRIYQLTSVVPPRPVPGRFRQAADTDLATVEAWSRAFAVETEMVDDAPEIAADIRRAVQSGRLFVWDDGGPVAMASRTGPTPNGMRVSFVFTPPALRGRGYASACVAALSASLLTSGRKFCFLFTDLANPTSNSIYAKIGYQPVCDVHEHRFDRRG